jgi:hypothetical protein
VVGRGVDIDVVDADARAADDDQVGRGVEHLVGHLGSRANDESVRVPDGVEELALGQIVGGFDLVTLVAEIGETSVRDWIRDEYLHARRDGWSRNNVCVLRSGGQKSRVLGATDTDSRETGRNHVASGRADTAPASAQICVSRAGTTEQNGSVDCAQRGSYRHAGRDAASSSGVER